MMPAVILVHSHYVLLHKIFGKKHVLFPELKYKKTVFKCKTLEITSLRKTLAIITSYTSVKFSPIFLIQRILLIL